MGSARTGSNPVVTVFVFAQISTCCFAIKTICFCENVCTEAEKEAARKAEEEEEAGRQAAIEELKAKRAAKELEKKKKEEERLERKKKVVNIFFSYKKIQKSFYKTHIYVIMQTFNLLM